MTLRLSTAAYSFRGADRTDVTRVGVDRAVKAGQPAPGLPFAPSHGILWPAKGHLDLVGALMRRSMTLTMDPAAAVTLYAADLLSNVDRAYARLYTAELRVSYGLHEARWGPDETAAYRNGVRPQRAAWDAMLARESAVVVCMCGRREPGDGQVHRCHRSHLAGVLAKLGATDAGEVVSDKPARGTAPRPWPHRDALVAVSGARPPRGDDAGAANVALHREMVASCKAAVRALPKGSVVVHGGAKGIDEAAGVAAHEAGHAVIVVPSWWDAWGRAAPVKRNVYVAACDRLLAFEAPWGKGTQHAIGLARAAGVDVSVYG